MRNCFIYLILLCATTVVEAQFVFEKPPENFHPKIEVAGCFIKVGENVLFLKQQPYDSEPNTWAVPGGKIGKTESAEEGIIREVYEETGLDIKNNPPRFIGEVFIRLPEMDFLYAMFEICIENYPNVIIDPAEHSEYRWMTLETALELPLIRGEDECIRLVYKSLLK